MRLFLSEHTTDNKTNDYGAFPSLDNGTAERDEKANVDRWGENEGVCLGGEKKKTHLVGGSDSSVSPPRSVAPSASLPLPPSLSLGL